MLNVRRLLLLAEVAERGSLTAAAEALSMTTSAASQQMSLFEREAGQPLIERLPRGVRTTAAGAALAERGRTIRRELQAGEADLEAFGHLDRGVVTLGSFPTASASLLPLALTRFRRAHPQVRTVVRAGVLAQLREMLHTGEVELSLLWDYDWNRVDDDQLILTPLLEDPTVLVVPTSSPLVASEHVRLSELADQEWIIRAENHPVADVLRRACRQAGFEPRIAYASHDYQEAQAMVAAGLGLALAPRLALTNRRSDVRLLSLSHDQSSDVVSPVRRILLARPAQRAATPAAQAMARVLHAIARGFTDPGLDRPQLGAVRTR
ncbi:MULTISPECIES: LysR family transcriptional regulator [unclassified Streptomyces]|uniref:LysR family transcriptional regulator n=1 Tax=unclassified Streptomyces TaxID=2593676 RepID=UPI002DD9134E|nr:LysR family transcriptional regulator [Streptomyces sp. NBC_01445]WSE03905.1 LysR family transcriptional regulator [Streptomyces sp. NBC_01445]